MPAKDLGSKFACFKCGTKFYDLKKPDPLCPKCGADPREAVVAKPSRRVREKEPVKVEPEVEVPDAEDAAEDVDEEEGEDAGDDL